jgi:hypothetical protein
MQNHDAPDQRVSHGFPLLARPPLISFVFVGKFYKQWAMTSVSKLNKVSVRSIFSVSRLRGVLVGLVHIQPRQCPINLMYIYLYREPNTSLILRKISH